LFVCFPPKNDKKVEKSLILGYILVYHHNILQKKIMFLTYALKKFCGTTLVVWYFGKKNFTKKTKSDKKN